MSIIHLPISSRSASGTWDGERVRWGHCLHVFIPNPSISGSGSARFLSSHYKLSRSHWSSYILPSIVSPSITRGSGGSHITLQRSPALCVKLLWGDLFSLRVWVCFTQRTPYCIILWPCTIKREVKLLVTHKPSYKTQKYDCRSFFITLYFMPCSTWSQKREYSWRSWNSQHQSIQSIRCLLQIETKQDGAMTHKRQFHLGIHWCTTTSKYYIFPFAFNFLIMTFSIGMRVAAILDIVINDASRWS